MRPRSHPRLASTKTSRRDDILRASGNTLRLASCSAIEPATELAPALTSQQGPVRPDSHALRRARRSRCSFATTQFFDEFTAKGRKIVGLAASDPIAVHDDRFVL